MAPPLVREADGNFVFVSLPNSKVRLHLTLLFRMSSFERCREDLSIPIESHDFCPCFQSHNSTHIVGTLFIQIAIVSVVVRSGIKKSCGIVFVISNTTGPNFWKGFLVYSAKAKAFLSVFPRKFVLVLPNGHKCCFLVDGFSAEHVIALLV